MNERKKRGKPSKVDLLPSDIKADLDELLRNGKLTQKEILARINTRIEQAGLTEEDKLSAPGLNRYSTQMHTVGHEIKAMRESTEMWIAQFGSKPTSEAGQMLLEMLKTQHFRLLMEATADPEKVLDAKTINNLALALTRLERAAEINNKRMREIRKEMAEEAAKQVDEQREQLGVTVEGAQRFKDILTGLMQ